MSSQPEKSINTNAPILDEDEGPKVPDLSLIQLVYTICLSHPSVTTADVFNARNRLLSTIKSKNMLPFYEAIHEKCSIKLTADEIAQMKKNIDDKLAEFDAKHDDAEKNHGENEIREALLAKADFLADIGEKEKAETAYRITAEKTVAMGQRLDIVFTLIRIGLFWDDNNLVKTNIEKARTLIDQGGDWDRRNRLKAYEALYLASKREFGQSGKLFVDTLATFTSYELFDYKTFIFYSVLMNIITLDRVDLKKKIIDASEVLSVILEIPHLSDFLNSFYSCNYSLFFTTLAEVDEMMIKNKYLAAHSRYFSREMRIRAYAQLLESYRSVQLQSMAEQFGVTVDFLDKELSRFISVGRLNCKIDKVGGIVEMNRPDEKTTLFHSTIKQGDILLGRIQKLARVVDL
eukprot:TRINITY_DN3599_c0_g1_i1.p1 TRINITY_DN3599_c0_g1~~TRINITY_DN3599_c0_g1_i1.p1  ORF type:complete len:420 (+),score=203.72 TRINITY_DN3599_c0_g1_i1:50-1261(+)